MLGLKGKSNEPEIHKHSWEFQYQTGNMYDGKSTVYKCECGQWAVRHFGQSEYNLIK